MMPCMADRMRAWGHDVFGAWRDGAGKEEDRRARSGQMHEPEAAEYFQGISRSKSLNQKPSAMNGLDRVSTECRGRCGSE